MRRRLGIVRITLLTLMVAAVAAPAAHADTAVGFTVSPLRFDVDAPPGATREKTITITNNSGHSLHFSLGVEDFAGSNDDADASPVLLGAVAGNPISGASWISPNVRSFTLGAGDSRQVVAQISVPSGSTGGHYAALTVGTDTVAATDSIDVENRAGVLFLMNAGGVPPPKLVIKRVTNTTGGGVTIQYENQGASDATPRAEITYTDAFGNVIRRRIVDCDQTILPGATGSCTVSGARDDLGSGLPGPRRGEVRLVNGKESFSAKAPTSWAGSTTSILLPLVGLALLVGYFVSVRRRVGRGVDPSLFD